MRDWIVDVYRACWLIRKYVADRLEASKFKAGKSQRNQLNRFNTFVREGGHEGEEGFGPTASQPTASTSTLARVNHISSSSADDRVASQRSSGMQKGDTNGKGKMKGKHSQPFELVHVIHASETGNVGSDAVHKLEV
jgi:hypothetical protein